MKKVTAFIGSQRKKSTYHAVQEFTENLKQYGDIDFEYVFLSDYHLEFCQGCKLCFVKGKTNRMEKNLKVAYLNSSCRAKVL